MEYQPLNAERNEIRLITLQHTGFLSRVWKSTLTSLSHSLPALSQPFPPDTVRCSMENVSLDEFTQESRDYMSSKGLRRYTVDDYWKMILARRATTGHSSHLGGGSVQNAYKAATVTVDETLVGSSWGRWTWGDYVALSYTWGDPTVTREILINDHVVKVTENLEAFLRQAASVPERHKGMRLWVDAICINQNDMTERNLQVKRMADIYEQAFSVLTWLGKEDDGSHFAMFLLNTIADKALGMPEERREFMDILRRVPDLFWTGSWKALEDFLSRPYWSRLWIIQEMVLSHTYLNVICGAKAISWLRLFAAIDFLSRDPKLLLTRIRADYEAVGEANLPTGILGRIHRLQQLAVFSQAEYEGEKGMNLAHLLSVARSSQQSDAKDKVYGILGLVDSSISSCILPNYDLPMSEIFTDFIKAAITATESLDIICQSRSELSEGDGIPSWIPDLSQPPAVSVEMTMKIPYSASGNIGFRGRFGDDRSLVAQGFAVDEVGGLGCDCMECDNSTDHDICQADSSPNPYPTDNDTREAVWRTLVANRDSKGNIAPDTYESLVHVIKLEYIYPDFVTDNLFYGLFGAALMCSGSLRFAGRDLLTHFEESGEYSFNFPSEQEVADACNRAFNVITGRKLLVTAKGYFGLATKTARKGDLICILLGCSVPIILRPNREKPEFYQLVGECYVHGIMEGESIRHRETDLDILEWFSIH